MNLKVCVTRKIPDRGLDLFSSNFKVKISPHNRVLNPDELLEFVKGQDAILALLTDTIDKPVLESAGPQLKIVANYAVGYDNIDVKTATNRKIFVTNTPGVLSEAVAEHTLGLMLAIARKIPQSERLVKRGFFKGWAPMLFLGSQLEGKTLGIIGLGRIGSAVAQRAFKGFGMRIIYYTRRRNKQFERQFKAKFVTLTTLLKQSDFISLHVPLNKSTYHLIDKSELNLLKPTTYLINTSRGAVINEAELASALKQEKLAGAALDVFEHEPTITPLLKKLENAVLTPHTASATNEAREAMAQMAVKNIILTLTNKIPLNLVNPEVIKSNHARST